MDTDSYTDGDDADSSEADTIPHIPLPPPIIPVAHPLRGLIHPGTYSGIYSRVTIQGTTPAVPINLADMTRVLVQGWKDNGEWPPKGTEPGMGGVKVDERMRERARVVERGM